jgi:hypothetical protein
MGRSKCGSEALLKITACGDVVLNCMTEALVNLEYLIDEEFLDQLYDNQVIKKALHHENQYEDQVRTSRTYQ